jgi:Gpi18-like mannosyltransferase
MLCTLIWSAILPFSLDKEGQKAGKNSNAKEITDLANAHILRRLAMPQLIVSILALTTFHVQIINRIASAYPLWYIHLAYAIAKDQGSGSKGKNWTKIGISIMICYSLVQAGLFSAFLPPA